MGKPSGAKFKKLHSGLHIITDCVCIICKSIGTGFANTEWPKFNGNRRLIICDECQIMTDEYGCLHIKGQWIKVK